MATARGSRPVVAPDETTFPMPWPAAAAPGDDLIAIGADLAPGTMLAAYRLGLFPMPVDPRLRQSKTAWYSPDPRGVLPLDRLRVSRSLARSVRRFDVRFDSEFSAVLRGCADPRRPGRWLTDEFVAAYRLLFEMGWARSVTVHDGDGLAGGLFGVRIDGFFAGVSMYHRADDASKVALVHLVDWLRETDALLLDVQWSTPHLRSLGAIEVPRATFLCDLDGAVDPLRGVA